MQFGSIPRQKPDILHVLMCKRLTFGVDCGITGARRIPEIELIRRPLGQSFMIVTLSGLSGCFLLPGGQAVDAAMVVHTAGSAQHTAAVRLPVQSADAYAAILSIVDRDAAIEVVNRNDKGMLLEVTEEGKRLTGQVTSLGPTESLLYIWADAGVSGRTGSELASNVIEAVCDELGVAFERVDY